MSIFGRSEAGTKGALQLVQRGTDKRIPVELVKQPSGEVLEPTELEGLHVMVSSESGTGCATIPHTIEDGKLVVEITADISQQLGLGVYTLTATGRIPDPAYADGYHDYEIVAPLCKVTKYGNNETPVKVTANVMEGFKGEKGEQGIPGQQGPIGPAGPAGPKGKSAYESYLDTTTDNPKLTEEQWAAINATTTQYIYRINKGKDAPMNEQTLSADQLMELDRHRRNIIKALRDKGVQVSDDEGLETLDRKISEMKAYAPIIFKAQQFIGWNDKEFPTMQLSESYRPADLNYCFARNPYLKELPTVRGLGDASNLNSFVNGCTALTNVSLPDLPIAQTTASIFYDCTALESATIGSMPKTMDTSSLFQGCGALITATIGATPKVASTRLMFFNCTALKSVSLDLSGGSITNSEYMFSGCSVLTNVSGVIDLTNTTKATSMFNGCSSLAEVRIKGLKTSIDLSVCVNLSMESARYLIDNLQTAKSQRIDLPRKLLEENEEALGDLGDTASDKGWTINYK